MSEVMLVRWPEEADEGRRLATAGAAVLYLVRNDADPPTPTTCLEDWVRIPGDERDLRARVSALELRALTHAGPPRVDDRGRFHYLGRVIVLPPDDVPLARALTENFGAVVADDVFTPSNGHDRPLRTRMSELRAHLRQLDLSVRRVRQHGYQMERR